MKITIELELVDHDAQVLRSWASVGRYFDSVERLADKIIEGETISSSLEQDSIAVQEDSITLKQSLSSLHFQVRQKLIEAGVKPL